MKTPSTVINENSANQDETSNGKKSEFSKKRPLPSIANEKNFEFTESMLTAATMHIRQKQRESGCAASKASCPKRPSSPRTRDVPRPVLGRRSPPIVSGPTHQGPCGDLPPRRTADGAHRRDLNPYECQQRQCGLRNPPWRTSCAVVEPTQAGSICFERLPRGLKQLEPVDLCYRHGHRRRLNSLAESQIVEGTQRRRAEKQKQRGDFDAKKKVDKNGLNTIVEEGDSRRDIGCVATRGCHFKESKSLFIDDSLETTDAASTYEQAGCLACEEVPVLTRSKSDEVTPSCDPLDHASLHAPSSALELDTRQNVLKAAQSNETAKVFEAEPTELCQGITPEPQVLVVKANSQIFDRPVNRLHTDERPKSFTSLSVSVERAGQFQETATKEQSWLEVPSGETNQSDFIEDHKVPISCTSSTDPPDIDGKSKDEEQTNFDVAEIEVITESLAGEVLERSNWDAFPFNREPKLRDPPTTSTALLVTSRELSLSEVGEPQHKIVAERSTSCRSITGASTCKEPSKETNRHADTSTHEEESHNEMPGFQRGRPNSSTSLQTEEVQHDLLDLDHSEQLSFSVDSSRDRRQIGTEDVVHTDRQKITPTDNMQTETADRQGLKDAQTEHTVPETESAMLTHNPNSITVDVPKSQTESLLSPERPLYIPDIAIGVRLFKTPKPSPVSSKESREQSPEKDSDRDSSLVYCEEHDGKAPEIFTIRKIESTENVGRIKYLVLPDKERILSDVNAGAITTRVEKREVITPRKGVQEYKRSSDDQAQDRPKCIQKDSVDESSRDDSDSRCSEVRVDCKTAEQEAVPIKKIDEEKTPTRDPRKASDDQHKMLAHYRKEAGRRARTKVVGELFPIKEDEQKVVQVATVEGPEDDKPVHSLIQKKYQTERSDQKETEQEEDDDESEEWFPPFVSPLTRSSAVSESGGPSPEEEQARSRRLNFPATGGFSQLLGYSLQGDGPWGQGDRIERPGNYVEPTATFEDMFNKFFTDITPLDLAFNSINVINSCSNSISYHSWDNQKRLLAALGDLKQDDTYKHALICPLARQCAAATKDFSQSLHKVFRRYSNRARASQEALIEYYKALAAGKVTSPEMLREIRRDGRRLFMVWEAGQYVTRYADDATQECSDSSSVSPSTTENASTENKDEPVMDR